ncbi:MAG: hypothetical protein KDE22_10050 [Rhodobacterales bacterium]|nr:hypothetical protein [Rhodobacterales bacterium]
MASEQNQQGADLDRAHSRLDQAVARLERALVQGAGTAAAGTSALQAENDRLRDQARAASAGLDATIARLRRLLGE